MAKENEKKPGFFKRLISTKGLTRVLLVGVVVAAVGVLASGLTAIAGIPTAVAVGIGVGTGVAAVAGAGIGAAGLTGLAARGVAHVAKMIFNKNYRNQVKERRQERKRQKQEEKERKKTEKQERKAAKKAKRANKKGTAPVDDALEVPDEIPGLGEEHPVIDDPIPVPVKKPSRKAGGLYDSLSDENKALYDRIMRKTARGIFAELTVDQVAYMRDLYHNKLEDLKSKVQSGVKLTDEEEKEAAQYAALYVKATNYEKKLRAKAEHDGIAHAFEGDDEAVRAAEEKIAERANRTKKTGSGR